MSVDIRSSVFSLPALAEVTRRLTGPYPDIRQREPFDESAMDPAVSQIFFQNNPWFTPDYVLKSLLTVMSGLNSGFGCQMPDADHGSGKTVALVIRPEAAFEGLGEILFSAASGCRCLVHLPEESIRPYRALMDLFEAEEGLLRGRVCFVTGSLPHFDGLVAINALKSNTAVSYLSGKPSLQINSRGYTATLTGNEDLKALSETAAGLCTHFGRSFFSITSLSVPEGYDFSPLFGAIQDYSSNAFNHRYFNHYEYHKSVFLINGIQHSDNGFMLFTPRQEYTGKTAVVTWTTHQQDTVSCQTENSSGNVQHLHNQVFSDGIVDERARLFFHANALKAFLADL